MLGTRAGGVGRQLTFAKREVMCRLGSLMHKQTSLRVHTENDVVGNPLMQRSRHAHLSIKQARWMIQLLRGGGYRTEKEKQM